MMDCSTPISNSGHASRVSDSTRKVFAHYMVGLACQQTREKWARDIKTAKLAGIDGFALNIGPSDHWTETQIYYAYKEAEEVHGFSVFISFDMAAGYWGISQAVELINRYKDSPAQMRVDGMPLVSTFEGPNWVDNWPTIRDQTGGICLIPDWSSLGPHGVGHRLDLIDGAFSWDAWPKAGQTKMTTVEDLLYRENLCGKKYMMGVSPWFYTNLPRWNKNWYCSSESLWYDRWQQVLEVMPDFVQIITWNDFGESSYICDASPPQVVSGAEKYVAGHCHAAFRAVLPYLIAAYKAAPVEVDWHGQDTAIAWYRTAPVRAQRYNGTVWGPGGTVSAAHGARDVISVMAVTRSLARINIAIGTSRRMTFETDSRSRVSYFELPFDSLTTGTVTLTLNGKTAVGPEIKGTCEGGNVSATHTRHAYQTSS
ncbi:glycoside hydrolase family 71 protein [Parathielavia appendiculata]|uniref:Glycoside hydrolase family 71 protein n=1 Tax=Parathielavia appendiculata TaxID=2587402 RepID=A0AAN6TQT9_9PEZI|nr:glycoside hydrolase family 71 protein [Parathielavia appendiculata]